jgi:outer membrane immunogenic protein
MKRWLLASTFLATSGAALAAPPVPTYSWTGCYVGANVGAGWNHNRISEPQSTDNFVPAGSLFDINSSAGFLGGGQIGCNYQFASNWVFGLQGDMSFGKFSAQANDPFFAGKNGDPLSLEVATQWIASAEGRLGYAWNNMLLYGTGGPAWARNKYNGRNLDTFGNPAGFCNSGGFISCNPSGSDTRLGWTLGFGLEWAFANNWSAGVAYNHYMFGTHSVTLSDPNAGTPAAIDVKQQIDTVKLSLNYRFSSGAH